jgi:hypothetical protein
MNEGIQGSQFADSATSEFNADEFITWSIISRISTATLVQVKKVTNAGGVAAVGFVDIQPLVNMVDGAGNAYPHGKIFQCPYFRLQGGTDAVILDPKVDDIGIAIFADRDISSVTVNKAQSNPGSSRKYSKADGIYIGGVLNGTPQQYVQFTTGGITVKSPSAVTIAAPSIKLENSGAALQTLLNSTLLTWLSAHTHSGVTAGSAASGPPATLPIPTTVSTTVTQAE